MKPRNDQPQVDAAQSSVCYRWLRRAKLIDGGEAAPGDVFDARGVPQIKLDRLVRAGRIGIRPASAR